MGFLIDTNIWIAIERGKISAADIHAITKQAAIFVSPVNIAEIRYGLELMSDPKSKQRGATMLRRMHRKPMLRMNPGKRFEVVAIDGRGVRNPGIAE